MDCASCASLYFSYRTNTQAHAHVLYSIVIAYVYCIVDIDNLMRLCMFFAPICVLYYGCYSLIFLLLFFFWRQQWRRRWRRRQQQQQQRRQLLCYLVLFAWTHIVHTKPIIHLFNTETHTHVHIYVHAFNVVVVVFNFSALPLYQKCIRLLSFLLHFHLNFRSWMCGFLRFQTLRRKQIRCSQRDLISRASVSTSFYWSCLCCRTTTT